ncbi:MAG: putative glycoside hydrolase [Bacteroidota bacterium]
MNRVLSLLSTIIVVVVLTMGHASPGQAAAQMAIMPAETINIAHFFKPPNGMDAATAVKNFHMFVLTNGDHSYRDRLAANGFSSTIPEYFRSDGIQDPGSCTATPINNQVAYQPGDFCFISANHPDWFLLDSRGRRITVTSGGQYYRMDPANPGWQEFFLTRVVASQSQNGWSALFLDNVEGGLGKFYGALPAKYPDNASYQSAIASFLHYLYVNYSQQYGRPIIGNIVARTDDPVWFTYLQYLSGAMQERFAVDWDETTYLTPDRWLKDLDFFERTQASGKYAILVAPGYQNDLQRQNFAFASYLLVNNGKAAFRYSTDGAYRDAWLYSNYKVNPGKPLGPRYQSGGLWRRDFTDGCVTVDPVSHSATLQFNGGACMPVSWAGGVVVQSNQPVVSVGRPHVAEQVMTYNGYSGGSSSMYVPMLFKGAFGGSYNSAFYVQNVNGSNTASVTIKYYDSSGALNCSVNDTIAPLASKGYWVPNIACLPAGWVGGVAITSNQDIVAVGRPHIGNQVTTYNGFAKGSPSMYVPMLFKGAFGGSYNSAFYVQNVNGSNTASVTIKYYDSSGALNCSVDDTIAPFASKSYWLPNVACLPAGWVGGVVVTSSQDIVAVGRPHIGKEVTTYDGFADGSPSMYVPMLFKGAFGGSYNSAFYVQNVNGSNTASVSIKYYNSDGKLVCSMSDTLAPHASKSYWVPSAPCLPAGWVGGAIVESNQNIVAVGRPHIGAEVTSYPGFSGGSQSLYIPMLFKNMWSSYNSAFYLQNMDSGSSADVTLRFYDVGGKLVCTRNDTIPPLASLGYWLPTVSCNY